MTFEYFLFKGILTSMMFIGLFGLTFYLLFVIDKVVTKIVNFISDIRGKKNE